MRSLLRREYNFSRTPGRTYSVPCVFSTEQLRYPKPDGGVCQSKSFVGEGVKLDCAGGFGAVTMVTASFGMVAAARAVDKLVAGARRPRAQRSQLTKKCRSRSVMRLHGKFRCHKRFTYQPFG